MMSVIIAGINILQDYLKFITSHEKQCKHFVVFALFKIAIGASHKSTKNGVGTTIEHWR